MANTSAIPILESKQIQLDLLATLRQDRVDSHRIQRRVTQESQGFQEARAQESQLVSQEKDKKVNRMKDQCQYL